MPRIKTLEQLEIEEKFWERVDKNGPIHPVHGQCWEWIGGKATGVCTKEVMPIGCLVKSAAERRQANYLFATSVIIRFVFVQVICFLERRKTTYMTHLSKGG